ncbi:hypothetical protein IG611_15280 [Pectobacterium sp. A535-S3-A17]|uniref:DUF6631 family protein n=1 Tax=Pectobacterium quasiaquaticum TaxID=2774015 RepID=UPI001874704C|nr:DUF6631 family protein [Pectobacterium quasiaquaticum]MBE5226706.1 hypothetical protein [Pectobacterium quasiaquaticum]
MSEQNNTANELETLISSREINIAGESLTVREYSLVDSLTLHEPIAKLVLALADVMKDRALAFDDVEALLARHADIIPVLIARSVNKPAEWAMTLNASEGQTLMDWWWTVNKRFFTTAAVRRLTVLGVKDNRPSDSAASSQHSSEPGTMPNDSSTTLTAS